jgi:hypothetical protein
MNSPRKSKQTKNCIKVEAKKNNKDPVSSFNGATMVQNHIVILNKCLPKKKPIKKKPKGTG